MNLSPIGFGAFKIGRNQKTKYPEPYGLPDLGAVRSLLNGVLDLGIRYIDTAPAYGLSEARTGEVLSHRRSEFVLSTKVGEIFENGQSCYDFSQAAVRQSVLRSLERLRTDVLDIVFIHSNGEDEKIMMESGAVSALRTLREQGLVSKIGLSAKTVEGAKASLAWADALMVEYHVEERSFEPVMREAADAGILVVVKKGLASGRLPAGEAIRFVLGNPCVGSLTVGSLNLEHLRENVALAAACRPLASPVT